MKLGVTPAIGTSPVRIAAVCGRFEIAMSSLMSAKALSPFYPCNPAKLDVIKELVGRWRWLVFRNPSRACARPPGFLPAPALAEFYHPGRPRWGRGAADLL